MTTCRLSARRRIPTGKPPTFSSLPAGVISRPSGRMTLPSLLRAAGRSASADGAPGLQLTGNVSAWQAATRTSATASFMAHRLTPALTTGSSPRTPIDVQHPYAEFVGRVEKPARYLGGEYQMVRKDPSSVDVRVALAFPDLYDIGMSHLGT